MSRHDEGMPPAGLERALDLVASQVGEKDVAEATWRRGRAARRRRHAVVGGAAAGVVALGALGWSVLVSTPDPANGPAATTQDGTVSVTAEPDPVRLRAERLQTHLQAGCLREKGWRVTVDQETGRWRGAERSRAADGDSADLGAHLDACEALLGMGPELDVDPGDPVAERRAERVMAQVYDEYGVVASCLEETWWAWVTVPDRESFVYEYSRSGRVPWHPYSSWSSSGRLEEIAQSCPVEATWEAP